MPNHASFDKAAHDTAVNQRHATRVRWEKNPDREKNDNRSLDLRLQVVEALLGLRP